MKNAIREGILAYFSYEEKCITPQSYNFSAKRARKDEIVGEKFFKGRLLMLNILAFGGFAWIVRYFYYTANVSYY